MDLSNYTQIVTPNSSIAVSNIQVTGTSTTVNTTDLLIEDNKVVLNSTATSPILDASLIVNRGSSANVAIVWSESLGKWQQTRDGITYSDIPTNTGELLENPNNLYFTNARANTAIASFTGNLSAGNATIGNTVIANTLVGNISYKNLIELPIIKIPFSFSTLSPAIVATIPANSTVSKVEVLISTPFSNSTSTLTAGTITNTTEFVNSTDNKPSIEGLYTILTNLVYTSATQVLLTISPKNSNSGNGMLIIYY